MKKSISLIIITLFLILFSFALPSGIQAAEFHFKSYTLTQEETVKDDIYAFGDSVKIDGVIDGDLIVIASNVQLNGTVTGDAYLFGTTVNINGNVIGTTTIFGNNTSVQGVLSENVSIVSTYITFNAQTSKDVFALSAENTFQGSIGDDLRAYSIKSNIDSTVSGDLLLLGNDYTVSEEKISRNIWKPTFCRLRPMPGLTKRKQRLAMNSLSQGSFTNMLPHARATKYILRLKIWKIRNWI